MTRIELIHVFIFNGRVADEIFIDALNRCHKYLYFLTLFISVNQLELIRFFELPQLLELLWKLLRKGKVKFVKGNVALEIFIELLITLSFVLVLNLMRDISQIFKTLMLNIFWTLIQFFLQASTSKEEYTDLDNTMNLLIGCLKVYKFQNIFKGLIFFRVDRFHDCR